MSRSSGDSRHAGSHWPKGGEESGSGGLYIYLGTFRVEAVLADGDVLLQGIVDARLQVPLGGQLSAGCSELPGICVEVPFWAATPMQLAIHSAITVNLFTFVISSLFYGFIFANVVGWRKDCKSDRR